MALLDKAKSVCRVTSTAFDEEINDLIDAGFRDLGIADICDAYLVNEDTVDPLVLRALLTFVRMNFGTLEDGLYRRLKRSYDEQKAQLVYSSYYRGECDV